MNEALNLEYVRAFCEARNEGKTREQAAGIAHEKTQEYRIALLDLIDSRY
jgi:hypothetical protein